MSTTRTGCPRCGTSCGARSTTTSRQLPPGAGPSHVNDDFGDVYGVYVALYGEGYTNAELREAAKLVRRETGTLSEVKKVVLWGVEQEAVFVEMSRTRMAALEISQQEIFDALSAKNVAVNAGRLEVGPEYCPSTPRATSRRSSSSATCSSAARAGRIWCSCGTSPPSDETSRSAQATDALQRPAGRGHRHLDAPGRQRGASWASRSRSDFARLRRQIPLGMDFGVVGLQSQTVRESINWFWSTWSRP